MRASIVLLVTILALSSFPAAAQKFDGTFTASNDQGQQTVLKLVQSGQNVTGTMTTQGNTFQVDGALEEENLVGTMKLGSQGGFWFEADPDPKGLYVTLVAPGANGEPDYSTATEFLLHRLGSEAQVDGGGVAAGNETAAQPQSAPGTQTQPAPGIQPQPRPSPQMQQRQQGGTPAGIHDGSPQAVEWANFLANKKATKISSYSSSNTGGFGGYSSHTVYHLCANGQFFMTNSSSVSADVGGAFGNSAGSGSSAGTWRVFSQGQLVGIELHYQNGQVSQHRLDHDPQSGATYVDGERWYITPTDRCGS